MDADDYRWAADQLLARANKFRRSWQDASARRKHPNLVATMKIAERRATRIAKTFLDIAEEIEKE
jgi:hypothetical protein